jgi:hypothetical protein
VVRLPFSVRDNSGRATVYVRVKIIGKTYRAGATRSAKGQRQKIGIALPASVKGKGKFLVWAKDEAGNKSTKKSAKLTLKRGRGDRKAPKVEAYTVSGEASEKIKLSWRVSDNSGRVSCTVSVYQDKVRLAKQTFKKVSAPKAGAIHFVWWSSDPSVHEPLNFCALAKDAAGNKRKSCAPITLLGPVG